MTAMAPLNISAPRPARPQEARRVRELLVEAIDTSPYYNEEFKAFEKARFSELFVRKLIALDPWYVCVVDNGEDVVAFSFTVPEFGILWACWAYVRLDYRQSAAGLSMLRDHIAHWQDHRFHKIACYVRPDNRGALTIFRRLGLRETATLSSHIFGHDFVMLELPRRKVIADYDNGVAVPLSRRLAIQLAIWLGR
jgi:ribosomal protein S18 acetylase RimI-like enzyme